jgi:hypothetical protein
MIRSHSRLLLALLVIILVSLALLGAGWTWDGGSPPVALS